MCSCPKPSSCMFRHRVYCFMNLVLALLTFCASGWKSSSLQAWQVLWHWATSQSPHLSFCLWTLEIQIYERTKRKPMKTILSILFLFFSSYQKPSTKERRWKIFKNFSACPNCLFFSRSILKFYCFSTHSFMSYEKDINPSYLAMRIFCTTMSS